MACNSREFGGAIDGRGAQNAEPEADPSDDSATQTAPSRRFGTGRGRTGMFRTPPCQVSSWGRP